MLDTQRNEEFIETIRARLTEKRFVHSLNVADTARALASRFGADPEKAYTAGILHDICKDLPKAEQLQIIQKTDILILPVEYANPKLWHAVAGEITARDMLHVTDADILKAIRYHTTARAGMTLLEKAVYLADFISADRDYPGVDEMRAAVEQGLEHAMLEGMRFTIADLAQSGQAIHPDSVDAYNEIIMDKQRRRAEEKRMEERE